VALGGEHRYVAKAAVLRRALGGVSLGGLAEAAEPYADHVVGTGLRSEVRAGVAGTGRKATSWCSSRPRPSSTWRRSGAGSASYHEEKTVDLCEGGTGERGTGRAAPITPRRAAPEVVRPAETEEPTAHS